LNPGQAVNIRLTLVLPATAHAGSYASDILVTSLARRKSGTNIGTGAATALRFSVAHRRHR